MLGKTILFSGGKYDIAFIKQYLADKSFDTDMAKRIEALQTLQTKLSAYNKPAFLLGLRRQKLF